MTKCDKCDGTGKYYYSNTGTWKAEYLRSKGECMVVGSAFTWGVCNKCWGSGDLDNKGEDLTKGL